jgi:hypothetical protein
MTYIEEARLRTILRVAQQDLIQVEHELSTRMREIREFDAKIEARIGELESELDALETEIRNYQAQIRDIQKSVSFPDWVDYSRRVQPNEPDLDKNRRIAQPQTNLEGELRTLYRDLARRYHPDTAFDDLDRIYRNEMMMRINEAYSNRDLSEIRKLARGMVTISLEQPTQTEKHYASTYEKLEAEIAETKLKIEETKTNIEKLRFHPSVQLSLNVKLAWKEGKDLIGEMEKSLREKVTRKTGERDTLEKEYLALRLG